MPPELTANRTLPAEAMRSKAVWLMQGLLDESVGGYRVDREMLLDALVYAAAEGTGLHGACGMLGGMADDNTLRDHLIAAFPPIAAAEVNLQAKPIVLESVPQVVFSRRRELAIDLKDFPYYDQHWGLKPWICRDQARAGTTRFLRIATAYVMRAGQRVTLSAIQVSKHMSLGAVLSNLVGHLRFHGVKIVSRYLDRGFASVEVIRLIQYMRTPALNACPLRGTEDSGLRQYCVGRSCHMATHTSNSPNYGTAHATLAIAWS